MASSAQVQTHSAPWIGDIPAGWRIAPLFTILRERRKRNVGLTERNLLSLSYGRIVRKNIDSLEGLLPESFDTYQIVEEGDIVLRLTDLQNDQRSLRVGYARERGIITSAYVNLRRLSADDPRFLYYQLHSIDIQKIFYNFGGGIRQSMKFSDLKRLPLAMPSPAEQRAIADFLDRETAGIDDFIETERHLAKDLDELHSSHIDTAVTRGVEGHVRFQDSGVPWLGEVPVHWQVATFRRVATLRQGLQIPQEKRFYEPAPGRREYMTVKSVHDTSGAVAKESRTRLSRRFSAIPTWQSPKAAT